MHLKIAVSEDLTGFLRRRLRVEIFQLAQTTRRMRGRAAAIPEFRYHRSVLPRALLIDPNQCRISKFGSDF